MNVHYHPGKANVVAESFSRMSMGSTTHVEDGKKELVKDVHRLARLGVWFVDSTSGGILVHPSSESSLVVEVKDGQHLYPVLMALKESMLVKMNESFIVGFDGIVRYKDRLCVLDMDDLQTRIIVEAHSFKVFHTSRFHQDIS